MNGWIVLDGKRQSRALFSCGACKELWPGDASDWPNFCPFCRSTHLSKLSRLPVADDRVVAP